MVLYISKHIQIPLRQCSTYLSSFILRVSRILGDCLWGTDTSSRRSERDPPPRPRWQWEWSACYSRPNTPLLKQANRKSLSASKCSSFLNCYLLIPLPTYYCMRMEQVQSICACLHSFSVASSHLSHTVLCPGWKPGSAEEPAWPAAATTSEVDSQTCIWSSFHWLSWTSCRGPPNLNKSYLEGQGHQAAAFSWFKHKHHNSARQKPSLFLLAHFLQTGMGDRWAVSLVTKKTFFSWSKKLLR